MDKPIRVKFSGGREGIFHYFFQYTVIMKLLAGLKNEIVQCLKINVMLKEFDEKYQP